MQIILHLANVVRKSWNEREDEFIPRKPCFSYHNFNHIQFHKRLVHKTARKTFAAECNFDKERRALDQ